MKAFYEKYRSAIGAVLTIVLFYGFLHLIHITCPIKFVTGISCPGCGMTRAWLAAIRLNFTGAYRYHPLFWLVPFCLLGFPLKSRSPKLFRIALILVAVLFFAVYLVRMFDPACLVVVFAPQNGLVSRVAKFLLSKVGI